MAARITAARKTHEWLILERDDQIIGFAYGHAFNRFPRRALGAIEHRPDDSRDATA